MTWAQPLGDYYGWTLWIGGSPERRGDENCLLLDGDRHPIALRRDVEWRADGDLLVSVPYDADRPGGAAGGNDRRAERQLPVGSGRLRHDPAQLRTPATERSPAADGRGIPPLSFRCGPAENLLAFTVAALVLIVIPGPSVLFTIGRALALGRIGGLLSVLGNALGLLPVIGLVALGVGGIVARSVVLFTIVKVAGALYLMFLGVQAIRHRNRAAEAAISGALPRSHWRQLGEGFVVGITNPKTIAFFVAVLPQFVDLDAGSVPLQMIAARAGLLRDRPASPTPCGRSPPPAPAPGSASRRSASPRCRRPAAG